MPNQNKTFKLALIAGEASGDQHAASLARALSDTDKRFELSGMGMSAMQTAGVRLLERSDDIAVTGFVEVLRYYPKIRAKFKRLCAYLRANPPDLLILIDYPGFNLRLARFARRLGIKTLFYISPQIWAWRPGRVRKIAEVIDTMVVVFPFELAYYQSANIKVHCINHPLVDEARLAGVPSPDVISPRHTDSGSNKIEVLLLPGSREGEIKRLLPVLCQASRLMQQERDNLSFSLLLAPDVDQNWIQQTLSQHDLSCELTRDNYTAMCNADFAISASGTATLQLTLCATPMLVVYKMSWLTYLLMKLLIKTPHIALPNVLADRFIVPELIQRNANPQAICQTALDYLNNPERLEEIQNELRTVAAALGQGGASEQLADIVRGELEMTQKMG